MTTQDRIAQRLAESVEDDTSSPAAEMVRHFLRGFLVPTKTTEPLGQALAEGLLRPLLDMTDKQILMTIGRGFIESEAGKGATT